MRRLLPVLKIVILLAIVCGIAHTLLNAQEELMRHPWQARPLWLILSGVFYTLGQIPAGLFWHRVMTALGQHPSRGQALRAFFIGHLGKYVPGKGMVVVLRASMIRGERVDIAVAAACVFLETLSSMAVGSLLAAVILGVWLRGPWYLVFAALAIAAATGLPTWPPLFDLLLRKVGGAWASPGVMEKIRRIDYRTLVMGWVHLALGWVWMGLSLWAGLLGIGGGEEVSPAELPRYTAGVALATTAGFVSLIPAGAGVRELVLTEVLSPAVGKELGLVYAVALRLIWLVAELVVSGILYLGGPRRSLRSPQPSNESPHPPTP